MLYIKDSFVVVVVRLCLNLNKVLKNKITTDVQIYIGVQRDILRELDLIVVHTLQKNMFIDTVETLSSNVLASMASNWDSSFYYLTTECTHLQYLSTYVTGTVG